MSKFSSKSLKLLDTCDTQLQFIFKEVIKHYDCTVLYGYRSKEEQDELFRLGRSKLEGGKSKHNKNPSLAVDVSPYPIPDNWGDKNWKERAKFYHFAGYVKAIADKMNIKIRWGGDWSSNNDFDDQSWDDLVHFEILY